MPELVIRITRNRLPEEAYCNETPRGDSWPVCALRADHLQLGTMHECAAFRWDDLGNAPVMKSPAEQRQWDIEKRNAPDAISAEEIGPVTETILRQEFKDSIRIQKISATYDGQKWSSE